MPLSVAALAALACDRYGKLDVFISNAGIGPISKLEDLRVEDWEAMVDINIKGLLTLRRHSQPNQA